MYYITPGGDTVTIGNDQRVFRYRSNEADPGSVGSDPHNDPALDLATST